MKIAATTALVFLLGLGFTAGSALAGSSKKGAEPAAQVPAKSSSRYVINGGEVYDKKTDLTWQRCSVGQRWKDDMGCVGVVKEFSWSDAQQQAKSEWRVPNKDELATLIDYARKSSGAKPTIDEKAFPDMDMGKLWYWTSTPYDASGAWDVGFDGGSVGYNNRSYTNAVRLVRGGQ